MKDSKDSDRHGSDRFGSDRSGDRSTDRAEEGRHSPVRDLARKLFSTGAEAVQLTEDGLRNLVGEVNAKDSLKELLDSVTRGTDTVQNLLVREARHYLDTINFRDELGKVLANYSIEVNARINFIPREKTPEKKKGKTSSKDPEAARLEAEKCKVKFVAKEEEAEGSADDAGERSKGEK